MFVHSFGIGTVIKTLKIVLSSGQVSIRVMLYLDSGISMGDDILLRGYDLVIQ